MLSRRIHFIWGASKVIKGHWFLGLFGFYKRGDGNPLDAIAISVRGVLVWSAVGATLLYVAAATTVFWIWQKNPYTLLTYADALLYPARRAEIAGKKGQAFIAQGQDLFREKKWHDAANLLRLGLARFPRDFKARLTLAQFYVATNQRTLALRVLEEGLDENYPGRPYLQALLDTAGDGGDFDFVAQASGRYLAELKRNGPPQDYRWLRERRFAALLGADRAAEALAFAEAEELGNATIEPRVLALVALGRATEATALLRDWGEKSGADRKLVTRLLVRTTRESGKFDEMETALRALREKSPDDPAPLVYGLIQNAIAGREREAAAALEDYVFRYGGTLENLVLAATPLSEIGHLALLQRCVAAAAERGFPPFRLQTLQVGAFVQRGEWQSASEVLRKLVVPPGRDARQSELWRDWMQRIVDAATGVGEVAQLSLIDFMRSRPFPLRTLLVTAEAMQRAQRFETARQVVTLALHAYPSSKLATRLGAALDEALAARRASAAKTDPAPAAAPTVGTVASAAASPAAPARASALARDDTGQQLAQVRLHRTGGNTPRMVTAARLFLDGSDARAQALLDLARQFSAEGDTRAAVTLVREVLRRMPEFAPAARLLAELDTER